jgi:hypothetical protein
VATDLDTRVRSAASPDGQRPADDAPRPLARRWGPIAAAGAAVLLVALGVLAIQPLLAMQADLAAQRQLTEQLLERIDHQEELLERQVGLTEHMVEETVPLQEQLLQTTEEGVEVGHEGLEIGYEGIEIARESLEEIREMRRRMPESPAAVEDPALELAD